MGNEINYIGFGYDDQVAKEFENSHEPTMVIEGIRIMDTASNGNIDFNIFIANGLLCGYSTPGKKKPQLDPKKIDIKNARVRTLGHSDFDEIESLFSADELAALNPSEVYKVRLSNKTYYHLKDLEDGDFIGVDGEKRVYIFRHDPVSITESKISLITLLK